MLHERRHRWLHEHKKRSQRAKTCTNTHIFLTLSFFQWLLNCLLRVLRLDLVPLAARLLQAEDGKVAHCALAHVVARRALVAVQRELSLRCCLYHGSHILCLL